MQINDWLSLATRRLGKAGVGTTRLDALVLLEDISGKRREWLLAHPDYKLPESRIKKLDELIARRANHEPLAQIRGRTEFYGRKFIINKDVLEPRPESETMVDLLKSLVQGQTLDAPSVKNAKNDVHKVRPWTIIDVGTGSGALAITAKLEIPGARVLATDIDRKCLTLARRNARALSADTAFFHGDLLKAVPSAIHHLSSIRLAILANLPYVPDNFTINPAAMNEPKIAIFGGPDGLDIYRKLFSQIERLNIKPKAILTESMPPQHEKLTEVAKGSGYKQSRTDDFIQIFTLI